VEADLLACRIIASTGAATMACRVEHRVESAFDRIKSEEAEPWLEGHYADRRNGRGENRAKPETNRTAR
jgi:hypothetical protein